MSAGRIKDHNLYSMERITRMHGLLPSGDNRFSACVHLVSKANVLPEERIVVFAEPALADVNGRGSGRLGLVASRQ